MRYRLGILSGLAIIGIVALALVTGAVGSGTVEAAKPSVTVRVTAHSSSSAPTTLQESCDFSIQVAWEGNAFAHKNGLARIFLYNYNADRTQLISYGDKIVEKSPDGGSFVYSWDQPVAGEYLSKVLLYTSRGKGGLTLGHMLAGGEAPLTC